MDNLVMDGRQAEELAARYLQRQGLRLLCRNYRCKTGELDLIMRDRDALVFVEVRYRRTPRFGSATETVDWRKQQRLIRTAWHYLAQHGSRNPPCRFDIVGIGPVGGRLSFDWIKDAFRP